MWNNFHASCSSEIIWHMAEIHLRIFFRYASSSFCRFEVTMCISESEWMYMWVQCSCAIAIACSLVYKFMELADTCVKRYVNATFANEPEPWLCIIFRSVTLFVSVQWQNKVASSWFTRFIHVQTAPTPPIQQCVRASRFSCLTFLITVIPDWTPILN